MVRIRSLRFGVCLRASTIGTYLTPVCGRNRRRTPRVWYEDEMRYQIGFGIAFDPEDDVMM